jgi:5'-nucleotidase
VSETRLSGPHALVTNDDGIDAPGIRVLAEEAVAAGWRVTVAAPGWDASGASASFTAVEEALGVMAARRWTSRMPSAVAFAVEASPAFIVRAGVAGAFGDPPTAVFSGVNLGANVGRAVLHSGTVGAALTAATLGLPALAVSLATDVRDPSWDGVRRVLRQVLPAFVDADGIVVNLNVPDVEADEIQGIEAASLAPFGAVQVTNTERTGDRVKLTYSPWVAEEPPGSDAWMLNRGFATVTALEPVCEGRKDVAPFAGPLHPEGAG